MIGPMFRTLAAMAVMIGFATLANLQGMGPELNIIFSMIVFFGVKSIMNQLVIEAKTDRLIQEVEE